MARSTNEQNKTQNCNTRKASQKSTQSTTQKINSVAKVFVQQIEICLRRIFFNLLDSFCRCNFRF